MVGMRKLKVGDVNLGVIRALQPMMAGMRRRDRAVSEQLVRALTNVAFSIGRAEFPVRGTRREHLLAALGSASEARAVLHMAVDWGYCAPLRARGAQQLLDRTLSILVALVRRR